MNQPTKAPKTERLHSLDALRSIMMMLGLVLHSALTYGSVEYPEGWDLKDPYTTSLFFDFIVLIIHLFRMPIFFMIAGFFGALLFYERGPQKMMKNRFQRLVLPFVVFLFILTPFIQFAFYFSLAAMEGIANPWEQAVQFSSSLKAFIPTQTSHLWFLYYLLYITLAVFGMALLLKRMPTISSKLKEGFEWIFQKSITRILFFSGINLLILIAIQSDMVGTPSNFILRFDTFLFYSYFYLFGWLLFKSKHLLNSFTQYDWAFTILAFLLTTIQGLFYDTLGTGTKMVLNSFTIWLYLFGITGLFIRYTSEYSSKMRYISDASYWVYLIHLAIVGFIPGLIMNWPIPSFIKFTLVLLTATCICFVSYHYLVRNTFIGKFLNGRKYPINKIKKI